MVKKLENIEKREQKTEYAIIDGHKIKNYFKELDPEIKIEMLKTQKEKIV